jgi:predicted nucleotidyltransferase
MTNQAGLARAIEVLRQNRQYLTDKGVLHASVIGSVASGTDNLTSDLDVLIDAKAGHGLTIFDLVDIGDRLSHAYGRHVDIIPAGALRPRHQALRDGAVRAF